MAVAILSTVVTVVVANTILPVPNAIDRVLVLFELNMPVVKTNPAKSNVPLVNVVVAVATVVSAAANVVVPDVLLTVNAPNVVLVFGVIIPVPTIVDVNVVYVPVADKVNEFKFKLVVPGLNTVVPKSSLLK